MRQKIAFKITAIYVAFGVLWILLSDTLVEMFIQDIAILTRVQMIKGWFFIFCTALIFYVLIGRYMTRIVRSERALQRNDQVLRLFFQHAPAAIAMFDNDMKYIVASRRFLTDYNLGDQDIVGRSHYEVFPEITERWKEIHRRCLAGAIESSEEEPFLRTDGKKDWVRWEIRPWHEAQGEIGGIFLFSEVITERKQSEDELSKHREHLEELVRQRTRALEEKTQKVEKTQQALTYLLEDVNEARVETEGLNNELQAVNRELKDFAYIVSHDLKAPLRAVSQLAYWISEDHGNAIGAEGKEKVDLLISRVKRMDGLISGILKYSRAGRLGVKKESINLRGMLDGIIKALAPPEHILITLDENMPEIIGHRTGMEQVFQNLLGNALKFMDKRDGVVRVGCMDEGSQWKFSVADNGPGIAEKYYIRIFKIFQTLAPRDEQESTGIGLTIVRKIIEQHGGKIWVESKEGEGATFYFTLPKK